MHFVQLEMFDCGEQTEVCVHALQDLFGLCMYPYTAILVAFPVLYF